MTASRQSHREHGIEEAGSSKQPPLADWPTSKLLVFGVLLPILAVGLLVGGVAGLLRQENGLAGSIFIVAWLLFLDLGLTGLATLIFRELRRRRQAVAAGGSAWSEEKARRKQLADQELGALEDDVRKYTRGGLGCFLCGIPGLCILAAYVTSGQQPPSWAGLLTFPAVGLAPLLWLTGVHHGLWLWGNQKRPSKWLAYSALGLVGSLLLCGLVVHFLKARG